LKAICFSFRFLISRNNAWINSPSYLDGQINFDRVIREVSVSRHLVWLETGPNTVKYSSDFELGIACESVGDGENPEAPAPDPFSIETLP
jgi:hypothetical protein